MLEVKGVDDNQNKEKRRYLEQWVDTVNEDGNHGTWSWDVIFNPSELRNVIQKHATLEVSTNEFAKCPNCGKKAKGHEDIEKYFGYRNITGTMKPQSWCRDCRKLKKSGE